MRFRCTKCSRTEEYDFHEEALGAGWKFDMEGRWVCPSDSDEDNNEKTNPFSPSL